MVSENPSPGPSTAGSSQAMGVSLTLETVLGSTNPSINTLSAAVDAQCFAFCAGSIVVLSDIQSLGQRFFYAKPDALPAHVTPSYYNPATPTKATGNRALANTPTKDDSLLSLATFDSNVDHPAKGKLSHRSRSVTSVALSPSGQYLAVGEVGYHPRILVFSTATSASPDIPVACLTEHTFGVQAIAFSSDSKWLCSLGDLHDGGLFLWSINPKTGALKLNSSNRCTTADTIAWMGANVITVGTRHVKVWRFESPLSPAKCRRTLDTVSDLSNASPVPRTFAGRNVLLGELRDAVFTCALAIAEDAAVLCTQDGAICLLDDAHRSQRICQIAKRDHPITCATLDPSCGVVWLAGKGMEPEALPLEFFFAARAPSATSKQHKDFHVPDQQRKKEFSFSAICYADNRLVCADTSDGMSIYEVVSCPGQAPEASALRRLLAHNSAVIGVVVSSGPTVKDFDFLTYSARGDILYWSWDGSCTGACTVPLDASLALEADNSNELRVVRHLPTVNMLLTGDRTGIIRLLDTSGLVQVAVRGHDGEVYNLTVHVIDDDQSLAASSGRDRTVQIFRVSKNECSLEQSLINEHAGPIRQVEFTNGGSILVSMSSDRTLVIHQRVTRTDDSIAFVSTRTIHLKASPTSMTLIPGAPTSLLLSTLDRCFRKISIEGNTTQTVKESVILSRLTVGILHPGRTTVLAGFSSADGSIRLYDIESGSLLALFQGQTAVSALAFVQISGTGGMIKTRLVSTGASDGTIMLWNLTIPPQDETKHLGGNGFSNTDPSKPKPPSSMRLVRRILSKAEIASFQRSLKEKSDNRNSLSRNLSPSRLRRKASRYAISGGSEVPEPDACSKNHSSEMPGQDGVHSDRPKRASPPPSPRVSLQSRTRRSSLDERDRHTATKYADNIDGTARQISNMLQDFRKVMARSQRSLSINSAQALKRQLQATMDAIVPQEQQSDRTRDQMSCESFDDYLATMIDQRLALQSRKEDPSNSTSGS